MDWDRPRTDRRAASLVIVDRSGRTDASHHPPPGEKISSDLSQTTLAPGDDSPWRREEPERVRTRSRWIRDPSLGWDRTAPSRGPRDGVSKSPFWGPPFWGGPRGGPFPGGPGGGVHFRGYLITLPVGTDVSASFPWGVGFGGLFSGFSPPRGPPARGGPGDPPAGGHFGTDSRTAFPPSGRGATSRVPGRVLIRGATGRDYIRRGSRDSGVLAMGTARPSEELSSPAWTVLETGSDQSAAQHVPV